MVFWYKNDTDFTDDDFAIPLIADGDEVTELELENGQVPPPACGKCGALLTVVRHSFTAYAWSTKQGRWDPVEGHWELSTSTEVMDYDDGDLPIKHNGMWWVQCHFCSEMVGFENFPAGPQVEVISPEQINEDPLDGIERLLQRIGPSNFAGLIRAYQQYQVGKPDNPVTLLVFGQTMFTP